MEDLDADEVRSLQFRWSLWREGTITDEEFRAFLTPRYEGEQYIGSQHAGIYELYLMWLKT